MYHPPIAVVRTVLDWLAPNPVPPAHVRTEFGHMLSSTYFIALFSISAFVIWAIMAWRDNRELKKLVKRKLPVVKDSATQCKYCAKWDLSDGQEIMQKFPAFVGAANVVTPAEMAYGYKIDPETQQRVGLNGPKDASTLAWRDFGACSEHQELRHGRDTCLDFEARS